MHLTSNHNKAVSKILIGMRGDMRVEWDRAATRQAKEPPLYIPRPCANGAKAARASNSLTLLAWDGFRQLDDKT